MEKLLNEIKQYRKEQAELLDWNKNNGHPIMVSYDEGGLNACDKIIAIIERAVAKVCSNKVNQLIDVETFKSTPPVTTLTPVACDVCKRHPSVVISTPFGTFCPEHTRYS